MQLTQYQSLRNNINGLTYSNRSCHCHFEEKSHLPVQNIPNQIELTITHTKAALKRGLVRDIKQQITSTAVWGVVLEQTNPSKSKTILAAMIDPKMVKDLHENLSERRVEILLQRLEHLGWNTPVSSRFVKTPSEFVASAWGWDSRNHYRDWCQHRTYRQLSTLKDFETVQIFLTNRLIGLMTASVEDVVCSTAFALEKNFLINLKNEVCHLVGDVNNTHDSRAPLRVAERENWYQEFCLE